ncbi:anaphase-promoting complex subunit 7 [Phlebotomus argentipes]|uniref:anaphase-promoting complex subunit 7 n=1 Tax=Phlebotomus argentipes TaxID=94469 RepID=UPI002892C999|nr:anaphase-promoting complex subunit 7 [Phlebotomus argentipes]
MTSLFENLKKLYEYELYSDVMTLANLILCSYERHRLILSHQEHFLTLMYYGDALWSVHRYRKAEGLYRQALQAKKMLTKLKSPSGKQTTEPADPFPETEIKFKIAKCLVEVKQSQEAITVLQSIPVKQRSPKINALYGRLSQYNGHDRCAVSSYKEVLKECPLALEIMEGLLQLGVKGIEVNSLVVDATHWPQCSDWLTHWIEANSFIAFRKYPQAIQILKNLAGDSLIQDYNKLLVLIGESCYHNADYNNALNYLKRAHTLQPQATDGIMILSSLYAKKNKISELEKLITPSASVWEYTTENWFIMAQYLFVTGKYERAAYFAQKACFLDSRNIEAILLKANIFLELKKYKDALLHLRTVQLYAPYRFEMYKGLVDTYMRMLRFREAQTMAQNAVRFLGQSPRTFVLLARTYVRDVMVKFQATSMLEKALELDENYLPAVFMMAELLQEEGESAAAIALLKRQADVQPNSKVHCMLGDILGAQKDYSGALENYTVALSLDPANRKAITSLMAMGHPTGNTKIENAYVTPSTPEEGTSYPYELEEIPPPDIESESEAMWSDVEVEISST